MNGRLDTLQAAVLLAKLDVFEEELAARERIASAYDRLLAGHVTIPARVPDSASAWAIYAILLPDAAARDRMQAALRTEGVPTAIYYPRPLHRQPAYAPHHRGGPLPVSDDLCTRILALPIHPYLTETQVARIANAVIAAT
jgi:dTDP-4-amino-4,6-dideoxygalactose transaminase